MTGPNNSPTNAGSTNQLQAVVFANRYHLAFVVYCLLGFVTGAFLQAFAAEMLVELEWNRDLSTHWYVLWPISLTVSPALAVTGALRLVAKRWFTRLAVQRLTILLCAGFLVVFWLNSRHLYPW